MIGTGIQSLPTTRRKWTGGTKVLIQWNVLQNAVDVRYCQHICHQCGSFQWKQCVLQVICTKHDICHYNMLGFQLFCNSYVGGYGIIDPDGERNGARWQPFLFVPFWKRTFLIEVPGPGLEVVGDHYIGHLQFTPWKIKKWNLKITHEKKGTWSEPNLHDYSWLCSMFIFKGACNVDLFHRFCCNKTGVCCNR